MLELNSRRAEKPKGGNGAMRLVELLTQGQIIQARDSEGVMLTCSMEPL